MLKKIFKYSVKTRKKEKFLSIAKCDFIGQWSRIFGLQSIRCSILSFLTPYKINPNFLQSHCCIIAFSVVPKMSNSVHLPRILSTKCTKRGLTKINSASKFSNSGTNWTRNTPLAYFVGHAAHCWADVIDFK